MVLQALLRGGALATAMLTGCVCVVAVCMAEGCDCVGDEEKGRHAHQAAPACTAVKNARG